MEKKSFVWLSESCWSRKGRELITGETYKVADFDPKVVDYWVKCGDAEYVSSAAAKSKEEKK